MFKSFANRFTILLQFLVLINVAFSHNPVDLELSANVEIQPRAETDAEVNIIKHPYIVSVRRKNCSTCAFEHHCAGTIYNEEYIMTAANCVRDLERHNLHIVAGTSLLSRPLEDGGMIFPIDNIIVHEESNIDMALLRLAIQLPLKSSSVPVQAVKMSTITPASGALANIAGWGGNSEHLREAMIPIVDQFHCMCAFQRNIQEDYGFCAGATNANACYGEAGGPLLVEGKLVGIASRSPHCERSDSPGLYTNVAQLRDWIVGYVMNVRISFL